MFDLTCKIIYYFDEGDRSWKAHGFHAELFCKLWEHYHTLGVDAFRANSQEPFDTVEWRLNDSWYNSSQIERIKKLRAFI